MKFFNRAASVMIMLAIFVALSFGTAEALYEFQNVYKTGGLNTQWMVTRGSRTAGDNVFEDSGGSSTFNPMVISGDLINRANVRRLYVSGGKGENSDLQVEKIFLAISKNERTKEEQNKLAITFYAPPTDAGEPVTPEVNVEWRDNRDFAIIKNDISTETPVLNGMTGRTFEFTFNGYTAWNYGSYIGNIKFQQSPSEEGNPLRDSQTQEIPLILAYVYGHEADTLEPLRFRTILRDNVTQEIVGTNKFTWAVRNVESGGEAEKIVGKFDQATKGSDTQWVFTPLRTIDGSESANQYTLTTRIINRTGARYDTYNSSGKKSYLAASKWYFDITPTTESTYKELTQPFILDQRSHIAPGLATVYETAFDLSPERINTVMWLDCVDPKGNGGLGLTVNYRNVSGVIMNTVDGDLYNDESGPVPFNRLTAFIHRPIDTNFLTKVADAVRNDNAGVLKTIRTQTTPGNFIAQGDISGNELNYDEIIRAFTLKKAIPSNLRGDDYEAMVPLLVTFNIPFGYRNTGTWVNDMLWSWYKNGEGDDDLVSLFLQNFSVGLLSTVNVDNTRRYCNLREELSLDDYKDQIKIFMDEDRHVITISFIIMLMDGTATQGKPTIRLVEDSGTNRSNKFMIVRDGKADDEWNLTFYVAPANFQPVDENLAPEDNNNRGSWRDDDYEDEVVYTGGGNGGSSGCVANSGLSYVLVLGLALYVLRRKGA